MEALGGWGVYPLGGYGIMGYGMEKNPDILKCPRCHGTSVWVNEIIEAISQHKIVDGIWRHEYDMNEYGDGIRNECVCDGCGHRWRSRKGYNFDDYYIGQE